MNEKEMKKVTFNMQKLPSYRTYFVDGMFGGLTPKGKIYAELFIERYPTPTELTHQINDDFSLGEELQEERKSKKGVIREIECGIMMDVETAKAFKDWLDEKIKQYDKTVNALQEAAKK
jgi:hypothetical protein